MLNKAQNSCDCSTREGKLIEETLENVEKEMLKSCAYRDKLGRLFGDIKYKRNYQSV